PGAKRVGIAKGAAGARRGDSHSWARDACPDGRGASESTFGRAPTQEGNHGVPCEASPDILTRAHSGLLGFESHSLRRFEFFPEGGLVLILGDELPGVKRDACRPFVEFGALLREIIEDAAVRAVVGAQPDAIRRFNGVQGGSQRQRECRADGDFHLRFDDLPLYWLSCCGLDGGSGWQHFLTVGEGLYGPPARELQNVRVWALPREHRKGAPLQVTCSA